MFDWIRHQVLRFLRVPHDPAPPFGAPGSVRVFRAGRNYYKLKLARWGLGQFGAFIGLALSLAFFAWFQGEVEIASRNREQAVAAALAAKAHRLGRDEGDPRRDLRLLAARTPPWVMPVIAAFEVWGVLLFLLQLPVTFAAVRLNFEMHWYIVTDRSLRIRTGIWNLQEATMSFANLQQVEVKQGPLQRLLGLADVHVQSAGGGGEVPPGHHGDSMHTSVFHSVENATEIRDLILARLRRFRQAGLGDPDDHNHAVVAAPADGSNDALAAARELLAEARALRETVG